jgi:hypothetical protein
MTSITDGRAEGVNPSSRATGSGSAARLLGERPNCREAPVATFLRLLAAFPRSLDSTPVVPRSRECLRPGFPDVTGVRGVVVAMFAAVIWGALAASSAAPAVGSAELGVYRGGGNTDGVIEFEAWLGRPVTVAVDFLTHSTWSDIAAPSWWASRWGATSYRVVYSVPMLPDSGGTLEEGASGAYNDHFSELAQTLVAHGEPDAVIRIGWEFNGSWMKWNAQTNPAAFAGYWRQIVQTMRAVAGARFSFDWCPNRGRGSVAAELAYPGDAYVDYVGLDSYDTGWAAGWQDPVKRWETMLTEPYGLRWHKQFAAEHGKQMSYPEWGLWVRDDGHGGGDNPYYIQKMREWIDANDVAYHSYFEYDAPDGEHRLMTGQFPQGAAAFRSLFGPGAVAAQQPAPPPLLPAIPAVQPQPPLTVRVAAPPAVRPSPVTTLQQRVKRFRRLVARLRLLRLR